MSFVWFFLGIALFLCVLIMAGQWLLRKRNNELERIIHGVGMEDFDTPLEEDVMSSVQTISWVSFYVATDQAWNGRDVVDVLLQYGLVLDDDHLFSYKIDDCTWFRVAQATQPVSFDMDRLDDTAISGLAFFMDANEVDYPRAVFHKMVFILKEIARELNGLLVDQSRQVLTPDDFERISNQLPKYEDELVV